MDPRETYRVIATVEKNTAMADAKTIGINAKKVPADVATPLPPLNLIKGEKVCPKIAKNPTAMLQLKPNCVKLFMQTTGNAPFSASINNTVSPAFLPNTRSELVAPTFLLPCSNKFIL